MLSLCDGCLADMWYLAWYDKFWLIISNVDMSYIYFIEILLLEQHVIVVVANVESQNEIYMHVLMKEVVNKLTISSISRFLGF